ncbi:unnamed protein product, partial [Oncorhynchus mykiss]
VRSLAVPFNFAQGSLSNTLSLIFNPNLSLSCDPKITYAARDAQVSIALFIHLLGLNSDTTPSPDSGSGYTQLANRCQGLVDTPFRERGGGEGEDGERKQKSKKRQQPTSESPETGDQQVPDPRRNNKRKPLGVGYAARKSPLYDNCFLYAPDGQPLCTCDKKKAQWYLDKGIGGRQTPPYTLLAVPPLTVVHMYSQWERIGGFIL